MNLVNTLWVENYRPRKLDDLVLPEDYKFDFEKYIIKDREIPHLVLYGPPGGGKTTIAKIICSPEGILNYPDDNLLEVNGSAKETRGISFVQDVIEPFCRIPSSGNDKIKIVFIDESDYLTDTSFHSLRSIVEKYAMYCRFIFTCNYYTKIPDALRSRLRGYKFKQVPIEFAINYCKTILEKEEVPYEIKDIKFLVEHLYPDIRKIIDTLQKCSMSGTLKVTKDDVVTTEKAIVASVIEVCKYVESNNSKKMSNAISTIVPLVNSPDIEFRNLYSSLFLSKEIMAPVKIVVNKYCNSHKDCLVPPMHFLSCIFEIIQTLKKYYNLVKK